ncbi:hypothetical protein ACN27F_06165 [Solwaraspora sp. WMMB335]|uniref:hypothetical protein n=1 Tax=Solwaraspora sp. WMMB335 TaxID=3404118 RepID=UPI003B92A12D
MSRYREASPHVAQEGLVGRALVHARNYALATRTYAEVAGDAGRLAEAIGASLRLVGDPAAAGQVQWAARQLLETAVDVTDLDRAVAALRHVADSLTGSDRISIWMDLVATLRRRAELTGGIEEAEAAVAEARRAFDAAATGGTGDDRRSVLSTLGATQLNRYERTGLLAHLDEAITSLRDVAAWAISPTPVALTNLANALVIRYERLSEPQDLDQAIALSRRVLALAGLDAEVRSSVASTLGRALSMRYLKTGRLQDIDDAIDAVGVAMRAAPAAPRYAAIAAANLGLLRLDRFRRTRRPEDLVEAVRLARAGLKAMTDGSIAAERVPGQMVNLAVALAETYRSGGEAAPLDEAIELATRAAPLLNGVERHRQGVAGTLLTDRFRRDGDTADARAALDHLRASAETATAPAIVRVDAAMGWGQLAREVGDATGSAAALTLALDLIPQASWQGTTRRTREHALASVRGVASDAAAAMLDIADPAAAVSCLERGRGVLWTQQLELRGGLDQLAVVAPTLADRVESVRQRLGGGPEEGEALELQPLVKDGTHVARW